MESDGTHPRSRPNNNASSSNASSNQSNQRQLQRLRTTVSTTGVTAGVTAASTGDRGVEAARGVAGSDAGLSQCIGLRCTNRFCHHPDRFVG